MNRVPPALLAGLALAACSGEPRVSLPLTAPEGAHRLVKDFIEICSQALGDPPAAEKLAVERGWENSVDPSISEITGVTALEDPQDGSFIQITALKYPHLEGTACLMVARDMSLEDIAPAKIGETKGLVGDYSIIQEPNDVGRGMWSFIGPDGNAVTINVMATDNRFTQMNMNTSRRVTPKS